MIHNGPFVQFGLYTLGNEIFNIVVYTIDVVRPGLLLTDSVD